MREAQFGRWNHEESAFVVLSGDAACTFYNAQLPAMRRLVGCVVEANAMP